MIRILIALCFLPALSFPQIKVILDTDPGYDPDDVGCIAMLHTMASNGECEILAMMNSTDHMESPMALSAINLFYNRPNIPIGDYKGYTEKINAPVEFYSHHLANFYPSQLKDWTESQDAVKLYREILASAQDTSITIIVIGTMHNFYGLLKSESCMFSSLHGIELVRHKVNKVVTMGGNFMNGEGHDRTNWGGADVLCDYTSWSCINEERNRMCRYVIDNCPAPFIASGWEVGCGDYHDANFGNVITGPGLKNLDTNHIARRSYEYHFINRENKTDISRHSNDQCALHFAVRGDGENYVSFTNGRITLSERGECKWSPLPNRKQGYIQKKRDKNLIADEIESLMMGQVPVLNQNPPNQPLNLKYQIVENKLVLRWDHSVSNHSGSWVTSYNIYSNKKKVYTSYGNQWITSFQDQGSHLYDVKSVSASGIESKAATITIKI